MEDMEVVSAIPKFQAWLGHAMVQVTMIDTLMNTSDEYVNPSIGYYLTGENKGRAKAFNLSEAKLRRFSGIVDKNGREVYQGDILKITCNFPLRKGVEIDVVTWWKQGSWFCHDWTLYQLISNQIEGKQDFVVIGNVYENPELLS